MTGAAPSPVVPVSPSSLALTVAQTVGGNLASKNPTVSNALSSFTPTGEPISTAILSIGRFVLNQSAQKKEEKAARLAASTARDMGITSVFGQLIAENFDPNDQRTYDLLSAVKSDLENGDSANRGERQYQISRQAQEVYADQLLKGTAAIPDVLSLWTPGPQEAADAIGRQIGFSIFLGGMDKAIQKENGGTSASQVFKELYGYDASNSDSDIQKLVDVNYSLVGKIYQEKGFLNQQAQETTTSSGASSNPSISVTGASYQNVQTPQVSGRSGAIAAPAQGMPGYIIPLLLVGGIGIIFLIAKRK